MAKTAHFRCGKLYPGTGEAVLSDHTVVVQDGVVMQVAPTDQVAADPEAEAFDYSDRFVIPGLIDVHVHLSYGNAKSQEDIDIYSSLELRAARGVYFAQQVLAAGYTSIGALGDTGMVARAVRDVIEAGMFEAPRVTAAGPYITSRQGLTDWYPTWIGAPATSTGRLVTDRNEAIEEIRKQVKEGVDAVKIALDGFQTRPDGELIAGFTFDETRAMVDEVHRLGKKAVVHARGREASLYAAKAGVDLIFHASFMDDEGLEAAVANKCAIGPTLTAVANLRDFVEAPQMEGRRGPLAMEFETIAQTARRAFEAGVPLVTGTDSGFAFTPYGEWHAREIVIFVNDLGLTPLQALKAATSEAARFMKPRDRVGALAPGLRADLVALDGDPTQDISILLDSARFAAIVKDGRPVKPVRHGYNPRRVGDFTQVLTHDFYTRQRVAELRRQAQGAQADSESPWALWSASEKGAHPVPS